MKWNRLNNQNEGVSPVERPVERINAFNKFLNETNDAEFELHSKRKPAKGNRFRKLKHSLFN